jgi:branched-chain amino acid transport system ATP-binding protein
MALLEVDSLNKHFGGLLVVHDLSFELNEGEILSIIGPNGAGKTTVLNLLTGINQPDDGDIRFQGRSIVGLPPHKITALGMARTFQTLRLFLNMSIIENVMAAAYPHTRAGLLQIILRTPAWRREEAGIRTRAEESLAFFGQRLVGYRFDQPAYSLSYANRRRLEIARAMVTQPKLLLLDEPAAGMNPKETAEITRLIGQLRDEGNYTILLIEHDMNVVGDISDRVIALDYGQKVAEGSYHEVVGNERVIEAYLGRKRETKSKGRGMGIRRQRPGTGG